MSLTEKRDTLIKEWLQEVKEVIKTSSVSELTIETKSDRSDFVTNMDRVIEENLVQKIRVHFPEDKIVSEEGFGDELDTIDMDKDTVWFLDPIDGTMNFILQKENYATMLAVFEKGIGQQAYVCDIEQNKLYWAIKGQGVYCNDQLLSKIQNRALADGLFAANTKFLSDKQISLNTEILKRSLGVRTNGSAGLEAVELVKSNTVAYITFGLNPWDIAPGMVLLEENGGQSVRFDGKPIHLLEKAPIIMGTPQAISDIQKLL